MSHNNYKPPSTVPTVVSKYLLNKNFSRQCKTNMGENTKLRKYVSIDQQLSQLGHVCNAHL